MHRLTYMCFIFLLKQNAPINLQKDHQDSLSNDKKKKQTKKKHPNKTQNTVSRSLHSTLTKPHTFYRKLFLDNLRKLPIIRWSVCWAKICFSWTPRNFKAAFHFYSTFHRSAQNALQAFVAFIKTSAIIAEDNTSRKLSLMLERPVSEHQIWYVMNSSYSQN